MRRKQDKPSTAWPECAPGSVTTPGAALERQRQPLSWQGCSSRKSRRMVCQLSAGECRCAVEGIVHLAHSNAKQCAHAHQHTEPRAHQHAAMRNCINFHLNLDTHRATCTTHTAMRNCINSPELRGKVPCVVGSGVSLWVGEEAATDAWGQTII